jgi:hypothetical protein
MVVLRDPLRHAIGTAQGHPAAGPELVPPVTGLPGEPGPTFRRCRFELAQRGRRDILLRVERGRARDQHRAGLHFQPHLRLVEDPPLALADRHCRFAVVIALAEFLREHDALAAHLEARCRRMIARLHGDHAIAHHILQLPAEVLAVRAQHAQIDLHRGLHLHSHHVLHGPGENRRAAHRQQPIVDAEPLRKAGLGKHLLAKVDIHVAAPAAVIVVAFEEAIGVAVVGVYVHPIDLKAQRLGRGPDQAAHASVAHRHALFAARYRFAIDQVCIRNQRTEVDVTAGGLRRRGGGRAGRQKRPPCHLHFSARSSSFCTESVQQPASFRFSSVSPFHSNAAGTHSAGTVTRISVIVRLTI